MIRLTQKQWKLFRRLQRKHKVSTEFLRYNLANIEKIIWYETWPRIVIRRFAIRKSNRVFLISNRLRRVLFDQANRKIFLRFKQNIRQWSRRIVAYRRRIYGIEEYVEEVMCTPKTAPVDAQDVSRQLKEQLELLKSGRRQQPLIEANAKPVESVASSADDLNGHNEKSDSDLKNISNRSLNVALTPSESQQCNSLDHLLSKPINSLQEQLEVTPEKQMIITENLHPIKQLASDEKTEKDHNEYEPRLPVLQKSAETAKTGLNFLDMLMCKVAAGQQDSILAEKPSTLKAKTVTEPNKEHNQTVDSGDEFLGFEDTERVPGMLMTPIVPFPSRGDNKNSVFVSESLNEYMRANALESNYNIDEDKSIKRQFHTDLEGLMTAKTLPPSFDMPAVPDNLQKFRTVAERKNYLQKFAKNFRLSIINNEANIYRELQKRIRYQKTKHASLIVAQSASSSMSFTRSGWHVSSFINTDFNKYYYQMIDVDCGKYQLRLRGVRGNNDSFRKKHHLSRVAKPLKGCPRRCVDNEMWHHFKSIQTVSPKTKKLNKQPLPSVFKPCPLSHKTHQRPLDDDAAALLLAGGSMAVVRMPTVELEVFPECGRPLNELAKRYLQYILPHHDISREWAEFSVSTLKLPGSLKEAVRAATDSIPKKSFTFVIPYLNDRNHVLVRRVVDRSEKLDESFENCLESELVPKTDFSFRKDLDESDETLMECADVVSDMINTVAISCSENSFIKVDPDMLSEEKADALHSSPTPKPGRPSSSASTNSGGGPKKQTKQKRVLLELKRLNATIIDAAVKPEKNKAPCFEEFCVMGCVCESLAEGSRLRDHCGKAKCILDCNCKNPNQSRIMRLETDGRTITTEDAFMLRRKATARLARMEKEFTSTVVLTENETLLINETNNDKKRRCTKAPKRYEYEADSEEEPRRPQPKKAALTTIDNDKQLPLEIKELHEPVYVKEHILEQLKHCSVNLYKLEDMENVAPWCMVHQLYKCFCKGRAVEGKPMVIEKGENNTTIEHGGEEIQYDEKDLKMSGKARYTFDKEEKKRKYEDDGQSDDDIAAPKCGSPKLVNEVVSDEDLNAHNIDEEVITVDDNMELLVEDCNASFEETPSKKQKNKRNLHDVRKRFFAPRPDCCRRQIAVPRRMFLYCNRKRRLSILKSIKLEETEDTRLLLNEHIMRSVYYHKVDSMKNREKEANSRKKIMAEETQQKRNRKTINSSVSHQTDNEVVELLDDDEDMPNASQAQSGTPLPVLPVETNLANLPTTDNNDTLMLPKISNCFSLNAKANLQPRFIAITNSATIQQQQPQQTTPQMADFISASFDGGSPAETQQKAENCSPSPTTAASLISGSETLRDAYISVVRTMNTLVSKKMQDVDLALKRDSHVIPPPNADILCMMKWTNFLEAFRQGFAFIWQVKSSDGNYLVATIRNMLPMICDALGVVNITALKPDRLPLMGRMLLQNARNEETNKLAIVMQGKPSYWIVKGFLKAEPATACNRPTPETHPSLTRKINQLCVSIGKQRQKEVVAKEAPKQSWPPAIVTSNKPSKVAQIMPIPRNNKTEAQTQAQAVFVPLVKSQSGPAISNDNCPQATTSSCLPTRKAPANPPQKTAQKRKRKASGEMVNGKNANKMDAFSKMSTNIDFRQIACEDIEEIFIPEVEKNDHKWLVLDLHKDFSHIFVPDFRDLVSLDRIQKVMNFARQKNKVVKLQFFMNAPYDAFVTPRSDKKIYFGPLQLNMKAPTLVLLQSVDGQMMLRELYQLKHGIQKPAAERTRAFWLLYRNGQTQFDIDTMTSKALESGDIDSVADPASSNTNAQGAQEASNGAANAAAAADDDDEDCVIIDDQKEGSASNSQAQRFNFSIVSKPNDLCITPQTNSLPGPVPIQTLHTQSTTAGPAQTTDSAAVSSSLLKIPNTNTVIKPVMQMPINSSVRLSGTLPTQKSPVINPQSLLKLPRNAAITSIVPSPPDAPYGSTIYISSTAASSCDSGPTLTIAAEHEGDQPPKPFAQVLPEIKKPRPLDKQNYKLQPIKRRRVSMVCHNAFDLNSQSIAVNAVINKILPENGQDIQVDHTMEGNNQTPATSLASTIGSTTITKVMDSNCNSNARQSLLKNMTEPNKPVVFDVSFVDGTEEPAASIVIKPTTPSKPRDAATTGAVQPKASKMSKEPTKNSSSSTQTVGTMTNPPPAALPTKNIINKNAYKVFRLPTLPTVSSGAGQNQILSKLLNGPAMPRTVSSTATSTITSSAITPPANQARTAQPKTVLNTTNPIKITPITPSPTTKAIIKPVLSATTTSMMISTALKSAQAKQPAAAVQQPKETTKTTFSGLSSLTIKHILPKSTTATVVTNGPQQLAAEEAEKPEKQSPMTIASTVASPTSVASVVTTSTNANNSSSAASEASNDYDASLLQVEVKSEEMSTLNPTILPGHIQYGYIVSDVYEDERYVAKRVRDEFYIKVPPASILRLKGMADVNNYLNKVKSKSSDNNAAITPGRWRFKAASKNIQLENHQKALLARKTKLANGLVGKLPTRFNSMEFAKTQTADSAATATNEPILIDD